MTGHPTPGLLRQLGSFGVIGVASTLAYYVLFVLLRAPIGAQAANLLALLVTAVANTAANRRLTFGVRGGAGAVRHQLWARGLRRCPRAHVGRVVGAARAVPIPFGGWSWRCCSSRTWWRPC